MNTKSNSSHLKLVHDDPCPLGSKKFRTAEEGMLVTIMRYNGGKVPTLEEFLDFIYPDGVPEGATLELDIPEIMTGCHGE
jgi:hypothetical protein